MGENLTEEEIKEMIKEANKESEVELGEEDFIKFMSNSHLELQNKIFYKNLNSKFNLYNKFNLINLILKFEFKN